MRPGVGGVSIEWVPPKAQYPLPSSSHLFSTPCPLPSSIGTCGLGLPVKERSLQNNVHLGSRGANRQQKRRKNAGFGVRQAEFKSWLCSNLVE